MTSLCALVRDLALVVSLAVVLDRRLTPLFRVATKGLIRQEEARDALVLAAGGMSAPRRAGELHAVR